MPFTGRLGVMFSILLCASTGLAQQEVKVDKLGLVARTRADYYSR